jgi:hypothetical protein
VLKLVAVAAVVVLLLALADGLVVLCDEWFVP